MGLEYFIYDLITNPLFIVSTVIWIIIVMSILVLPKTKKNIIYMFPFLVMLKTARLNRFLRKVGRKYPNFWQIFWLLGAVISIFFTIYGIYFFSINLSQLILSPSIENFVAPLIPGVNVDFPLFSYFILPLILILTAHEFSHAIAAESEGIPIKSTGVFAAGLYYFLGYGAFVEIDEFYMNSPSIRPIKRIKILTAGSFANFLETLLAFFLLINSSGIIHFLGYGNETVTVDYVLPSSQGGYNENNIFAGDVILNVNGTILNLEAGIDLSSILENRTSVKCKPGDVLNLSVLDKSGRNLNRYVKLGHYLFMGFEYEFVNNTIVKITRVYKREEWGNNYDILKEGMLIREFNGQPLDKDSGLTPKYYLRLYNSDGNANLTLIDGKIIQIYIDYFPLVMGAFMFREFYTGAIFDKIDNYSVKVVKVFKNRTETGINEGRLFEGDRVIAVNSVPINLTNTTFEKFLKDIVGKIDAPKIITFTVLPSSSIKPANRSVIFMPIPKRYVFIGVQTSPYWLPHGYMAEIMGGKFPVWLEKEFFYFYILAISVTVFNMLPLPLVDGGKVTKELIEIIFGKNLTGPFKAIEYIEIDNREKVIHPKKKYIKQILNVTVKTDYRKGSISLMSYSVADRNMDGFVDTIIFDKKIRGTVEVIYEYYRDSKEPIKKKLYIFIVLLTSLIIILNFLISTLLFGNPTILLR